MKNNPLAIFIGLALATALVLAGVTKDRWYKSAPQAAADVTVTPTEPAQPAQPAAETQQAAAPAAEQAPAPTAEQAPAPAAEQPSAPAQPAAGQQVAAAAPSEPEAAAPAAEEPGFDTVRIDKTGEAVIAGRAVAGSEVVIKLNGQPIGSATSNQDGNFVVVPEQPLPAGTGALTLEVKRSEERRVGKECRL